MMLKLNRKLMLSITMLTFVSLYLVSCIDIWVQPPRSEANKSALERVEIRTYDFTEAGEFQSEYGLYVPTSYKAENPAPLLIALHGHGSGAMYMMEYNNLVELAENYGFIVATPVGFSERGWFGSKPMSNFLVASRNRNLEAEEISHLSERDVINVLEKVQSDFNIDANKTYLIGQSMGGGGTWYLASKYPDIWAAVAPLSPATGEDPEILDSMAHIPVLLIAGDRDIEVDIEATRAWPKRMAELDMNYEYLEIEGGTHSASGRANIDKVFEFLSRHSK